MSKFLKIDHSHPALSSHARSSRLSPPPSPLQSTVAQIYSLSRTHVALSLRVVAALIALDNGRAIPSKLTTCHIYSNYVIKSGVPRSLRRRAQVTLTVLGL